LRFFPPQWNLAIGQTLGAWRQFPKTYSAITSPAREKPLLISGAYRSGTSWLGNLLTTPSTWHLHEPFNPRAGFLNDNFVYRRWSERDLELDVFVLRLLSGCSIFEKNVGLLQGIPVNRFLMPARLGLFRGAPRRILVKDPIACLLTEYLVRNHAFRALLIIRHPAGFVSSLHKLGWDSAEEVRRMLGDEKLMADWLGPFEQLMNHATRSPGVLAHATLYAAIWRVLHGFTLQNSEISVILYERLCADMLGETKALFRQYALGEVNGAQLKLYSRARAGNSKFTGDSPYSLNRDTAKMAKVWRDRMDQRSIATTREVWTKFEVPYYQCNADWED
jgi:hypothetical protein